MGDQIHISGVQGESVVVGKVTGSGNVIGKDNTVSGTIQVSADRYAHMPKDFSEGLKKFLEEVNKLTSSANLPPEKIAPAKQAVEEFVKEADEAFETKAETETAAPNKATTPPPLPNLSYTKKSSLKDKFIRMAAGLTKILPKTAETIAAFTPLAPFSKLIGEGVGEIVKAVSSES